MEYKEDIQILENSKAISQIDITTESEIKAVAKENININDFILDVADLIEDQSLPSPKLK